MVSSEARQKLIILNCLLLSTDLTDHQLFFSYVFEIVFKILTGLQFPISYLLFFLYYGFTVPSFRPAGTSLVSIGKFKMFVSSYTNLTNIPSSLALFFFFF